MNIFSYLFPKKIEQVSSGYNGVIVVEEFFGKLSLKVDGLIQSGQWLEQIFEKGFNELNVGSYPIKQILLLGVAGGSIARVLNRLFPETQITGVDIDPAMIALGKKYFQLDEIKNINIHIADAQTFIKNYPKKPKFDLVIVDLFKGDANPGFMSNQDFLGNLKKITAPNGMMIFNVLNYQKYKNEADKFLDKMRQTFQDVEGLPVYYNLFVIVRLST